MANDVVEFAKEKDTKELRQIANAIQIATENAARGNHHFLVYLLNMAALETKELLQKKQHGEQERS